MFHLQFYEFYLMILLHLIDLTSHLSFKGHDWFRFSKAGNFETIVLRSLKKKLVNLKETLTERTKLLTLKLSLTLFLLTHIYISKGSWIGSRHSVPHCCSQHLHKPPDIRGVLLLGEGQSGQQGREQQKQYGLFPIQ